MFYLEQEKHTYKAVSYSGVLSQNESKALLLRLFIVLGLWIVFLRNGVSGLTYFYQGGGLVGLKSLISDTNGHLDSWHMLAVGDTCSWEGVTCDITGDHVVHVNLTNFGMIGKWETISLAALHTVQIMELDGNLLYGSISPYYSALTSLQMLSMVGNSFSGSLPPEICYLTSLQKVIAPGNQLSGQLPVEMSSITALQQWVTGGNYFNGTLPQEWSKLSLLTTLDLKDNQLSGTIPPSFAVLSILTMFDLSENVDICGVIPAGVTVAATGTLLGGPCVYQVSPLLQFKDALDFFGPEVAAWSQLDIFNACVSWDGITCDDNFNIISLDFANFQLGGTLVPYFSELSHLIQLKFQNNTDLRGTLPAEYSSLTKLQELVFNDTLLQNSTIPHQWCALTTLQKLILVETGVQGTIPPDLSRLHNLEQLKLISGKASGTIPVEYSTMSNLITLTLRSNQLVGQIPCEFSALQLQRLVINRNSFSGSLCNQWSTWKSLTNILGQFNQLFGRLPEEWSEWRAINEMQQQ